MTLPQGVALTVGAVLGTGVISLPAIAAAVAGPASVVAWLGLVVVSAPLAFTFAALGARHPDAGGVATYVRRAFGDAAAGVVGWCFYFAVAVGAAPASLMAGGYVADTLGRGRTVSVLVAAGLMVIVVATNLVGLRLSGRVQLGLTGVLAALLVVVVVVSLPHADTANLHPFAPHGWTAIGSAAAVLVWGFAGWEAISPLAAEFRRPGRDVPRAVVVALVVVGVLYLAVVVASILVLGAMAGASSAPLSDLLARGFGGAARPATAAVAVLLTFGTMNAYVAGGAKLAAALGRDGSLPVWFARGSAVGEVPRRGIGVIAVLMGASLVAYATLGLQMRFTMLLTTGCFTLVYVLGTAAALRLLPRRGASWWLAVVAFAAVLALAAFTGAHMLWALSAAVASLGYHAWARHRARAGRRPARQVTIPRPDQASPGAGIAGTDVRDDPAEAAGHVGP